MSEPWVKRTTEEEQMTVIRNASDETLEIASAFCGRRWEPEYARFGVHVETELLERLYARINARREALRTLGGI